MSITGREGVSLIELFILGIEGVCFCTFCLAIRLAVGVYEGGKE